MRLASAFTRLLLVAVVAGAFLGGTGTNAALPLAESLRQSFGGLQEVLEPEAEEQAPVRRSHPLSAGSVRRVGRPSRGLGGASLEADTNLDSTARGLTSENEWRQIFPRKRN